ncbi:MAG: hypothetical protein L6R40_006112 [Gallowayella cf. fulva]|nr:MAG: hypothetical protein L6R40_006112 [Xanthomendoza cf. fulva]
MAEIIGITIAIAQITPAILDYIRNVRNGPSECRQLLLEISSTTGVVLLLRDLAQETTSSDSWSASLKSLGELLTDYERQLRDVAHTLEKTTTSQREALKWPFERKAVAETLTNLERYKTAFLLALQTVQSEVSNSIRRNLEDIGSDVRQSREAIEWLRDSQLDKDYEMMLQWISPLSFHLVHNDNLQRRHGDTGDWILREPSFQSWLSAGLDTLCCEGIPGAGKTILASIVVDHLRLQGESRSTIHGSSSTTSGRTDSSLTYLFCTYKERATQTAENLFGSLVKQLAEAYPKRFSPYVKELYQTRNDTYERPLLADFVSMLASMLRSFRRNYIVVDALDECADEIKDSLMNGFETLQQICSLRMLFTLRPGTITGLLDLNKTAFLEIRARDEDIGEYLSSRISSERRSFASFKKKPELVTLAIETITASSRGMFLLARLHLDSVARATSAAALKASLQRLPRQLNTTYDEALRRIEDQDDEHAALAKKLLAWILYASRSLTVLELQHALAAESTEPPQGVDEEYIIHPDDIIHSCAGLITLDKKTNVIRMVHYSAQEYFSANRQTHFPSGHEDLAMVCLKYLTSDLFSNGRCKDKTELQSKGEINPFLDYAGRFWGHHAQQAISNERMTSEVLRFMKMSQNLSCATQVAMQEFMHRSWDKHPADGPVLPPLVIAAKYGLVDVAASLLDASADVNVLARQPDGVSALGVASQNGHLEVVRLLLNRGANVQRPHVQNVSAIHRAASNNHPLIVELLLQFDPQAVRARNSYGKTALHDAAERGFVDVVQVLIRHEAGLRGKDNAKKTPLSYAAASGSIPCVQALLESGVSVDHSEAGVKQATYAAAAASQHSMLQYLFDKGAQVDVRGIHKNNVLHGTVCGGADPAIINLIMETGQKQDRVSSLLNARNMHGKPPLMDAIERNRLAAVAIMLGFDDLDLGIVDNDGRTALHWAVWRNFPAITRLLLEKSKDKAFVGRRAGEKFGNMTALEMAVEKGFVENIKIISEAL